MISLGDNRTRFRIIDLETTGISPDDHVVEIAAVDLIDGKVMPIRSDLVRSPLPIPPGASAIHHITDRDVEGSPALEAVLPFYMDTDCTDGVDVFVAHKWAFEQQWLGDHLHGRPSICTYKAALRVWPDALGHSNQTLRYWLNPGGLDPLLAIPSHRALPDAYVTAFILRELLQVATVQELITWTDKPALLPRVTFGRYRGCGWDEVPPDYLTWIIDKSEMGEDVKFTAKHHSEC